jgi:CRP-like cAMP-binding protein
MAEVAAIARPAGWPSGAVLFQRGDAAEFMLIIESGRVRLNLATAGGRELVLRHAGPGAVVGEMGILDDRQRSADATAVGALKGLVIHRAPFLALLARRPGLALAVIRYLTRRLNETTYQLETLALFGLEARLARFLLAALNQAHGGRPPARALLTLDLGQSDIAAILGASRPKTNRAFVALLKSNAIARTGRGLTCDVARLTAVADGDDA